MKNTSEEGFSWSSAGVGRHNYWRYLPHTILTTGVVAIGPLWLSIWLLDLNFIVSTVFALVISLFLGAAGAAIWQRMEGSRDLVFDDLLLWKFIRRIRRERSTAELAQRLGGGLEGAQLSTEERVELLKKLAATLEQGDPFTHGHSQRVARHAVMMAKELRLDHRTREKIMLAGLLHDVGKLRIPREILHKNGRLTDEEYEIVKEHPGIGAEMLSSLDDPELIAIVRNHHERVDGTGYPDRISGKAIPLGARVIAVADTFDAITSKRPYRDARRHRLAIKILEQEAGRQLDGDVVKAFLSYFKGRRSISIWSLITNAIRTGPRYLAEAAGRSMPGVANALVVSGMSAALTLSPVGAPAGQPASADQPVAAVAPQNSGTEGPMVFDHAPLGEEDGSARDPFAPDDPKLNPPEPSDPAEAEVPDEAPPPAPSQDTPMDDAPPQNDPQDPPAHEPPAHEPPTDQPPAHEPPAEEPPVVEPPVEEPPVEEPPVEEPPVEEPPPVQPPAPDPPHAEFPPEEPPADEPPADEPPADEPDEDQPGNGCDQRPDHPHCTPEFCAAHPNDRHCRTDEDVDPPGSDCEGQPDHPHCTPEYCAAHPNDRHCLSDPEPPPDDPPSEGPPDDGGVPPDEVVSPPDEGGAPPDEVVSPQEEQAQPDPDASVRPIGSPVEITPSDFPRNSRIRVRETLAAELG